MCVCVLVPRAPHSLCFLLLIDSLPPQILAARLLGSGFTLWRPHLAEEDVERLCLRLLYIASQGKSSSSGERGERREDKESSVATAKEAEDTLLEVRSTRSHANRV